MALVPNPVTGQLDVAEQVTVDGIAGTGTTGTIAKFTDTEQVGDSIITDDGATATIDGDLDVLGDILVNGTPISTGTPGGVAGSLQVNDGAGGFGEVGRRAFAIPGIETTDDATPVAVATVPLSANTNYRILVEAIGRTTVVGTGAVGDFSSNTTRIAAKRVAGGAIAIDAQLIASLSFAENTNAEITATANGNDIDIAIIGGDAATTVVWNFLISIDEV